MSLALTTLPGLDAAGQGLAQQAGQSLGVGNLGADLGLSGSWIARLKPASFRGVPFFVDEHDQDAGRHVVVHEFAQRENPYTEDMGRKAEQYRVRAYVTGATAASGTYLDAVTALYQACVRNSTPGKLIHPWLGELTVRCGPFRRSEKRDRGNYAAIDLLFYEAGSNPSPTATPDTAASSLAVVGQVLQAAKNIYAIAMVVVHNPAFLLGFVTGQLEALTDAFFGLPAGTAASLVSLGQSIAAAPSDTTATPAAITAAFSAYADTVAQAPAGTYPVGNDPSFGLAALSAFGDPSALIAGAPSNYSTLFPTVAATTPARQQQATNQAVLVATVQASALAATAQVYAQTTFTSQGAASTASAQLVQSIDTLAVTCADAGWLDLYTALVTLEGAVFTDMAQRAQQLPILGSYSTPQSLPELALAQLLYQDASRCDQLAALNDAIHPLFMPTTGVALTT